MAIGDQVSVHGPAFAGRVGWGARPAVVIVDLVRAYVEPEGPFWLGSSTVVDACAQLVAAAREADVPVVWTVVRYDADMTDAGFFAAKVPALACFAEGAPGGWGRMAITPEPPEGVVVKKQASAFAGTSLATAFRSRGVDTIVIAGVSTSGCVRATATDAMAAGFRPIVVAAACADRVAALHDANLADLDAKYADVIDLATATDRLSRTPKEP